MPSDFNHEKFTAYYLSPAYTDGMLTVSIIIVLVLGVYMVSLFSPGFANRLQKLSRWLHHQLDDFLKSKPTVVRMFVGTPVDMFHKAIQKSARGGKRTRRKVKD